MPPSEVPCPARYCQITAPSLSGSSAQPTPDFWPMTMRSLPPARVKIGEFPKSKSGPTSGQFGSVEPCRHQPPNTSLGVTCLVHLIFPLLRSNAITASLVASCGGVYVLPVDAYTKPRFVSIVGDDQIPAPEGPHNFVPAAFFPCGYGFGTRYVFHTNAPVFVSSADRLPLNVQHS